MNTDHSTSARSNVAGQGTVGSHWLHLLLSAVLAVGLLAGIAPVALAVDSADSTAVGTQSLDVGVGKTLAYKNTATAVGQGGLATTTLAIPAGLVPVVLRGNLTSVADNPGKVRIRAGSNFVTVDAQKGGPFALKIPADAVVDRNLMIEVRSTLDLPKGHCIFDTTTSETISQLVLEFIGKETPPQTIAGFFSPPVRKVTLISDAKSIADAESTLAAAAALGRRYDNNVEIVLATSLEFAQDPNALNPANGPKRAVKLLPDAKAKTVTALVTDPGIPLLTLAGPPEQLTNAAASLDSVGLGLAAVPAAEELAEQGASNAANSLSFADLGAKRPTLSGLGRLTFVVNAPQSRFGGPIESAQIHIAGVHTPVQPGAQVTVSILWNNQLIASKIVEDDFTYTADASVPPSLMDRDNYLTIRADAVSAQGGCESGAVPQGFQMDVDGSASTITAAPGQSLDDGFIRYPQAFGSDLHIAFGSGPVTTSLVQSCASFVISLQRATAQSLAIHTSDLAAFSDAQYPGFVVGATPEDATAMKAPLRFEPLRAVDLGQGLFTVKVNAPFAALEAFAVNGRDILLLGGTAPAAASNPLIEELAAKAKDGEFGWYGFNGTMLVAQPDADLLTLNSNSLAPQPSVVDETREIPWWWLALIAIILATVLARFMAVFARHRRVRRQIAAGDIADQEINESGDSGELQSDEPHTPSS